MSDEASNAAGSPSSPERAGFRITGRVVALAWAIAVAFAYIGTGGYLAQMIEGQDPALLSKTGVILAELVLLAAVVLTVIWARGRGRAVDVLRAVLAASPRRRSGGGVARRGESAGASRVPPRDVGRPGLCVFRAVRPAHTENLSPTSILVSMKSTVSCPG